MSTYEPNCFDNNGPREVVVDGQRGTFTPEDPGHKFARMCNDGRVKKKIWWASKEFQIEEVYQDDLKKYENSLFSRLFHKSPMRADGSTIKYNDMKSDDFYGWSK